MARALQQLILWVGIASACRALGVARASYYRSLKPPVPNPRRPSSHRALSHEENANILALLDSDEFCDKPPRQIYAARLDVGIYDASVSTYYRILNRAGQVKERRVQARHPKYAKPMLLAEKPNQVWSWDITKVPGPRRGIYFCLYVALDIYSRYVVGWAIAPSERSDIAASFLREAYIRENIKPGQVVIHSDRGAPMRAKTTTQLFAELGIVSSYSRPRVSNDNPYSEAGFKTLHYRPEMPERFGSLEDARAFYVDLFDWYNNRHYHTGIELLHPSDVHRGVADDIIASRQHVLDTAYELRPERFSHPPTHRRPSAAVWINPPSETSTI